MNTKQINLFGGHVQSVKMMNENGTYIDHKANGQFHFFVEVEDTDGDTLGIWSGADYSEAISITHEAAQDFNCPIHDCSIWGDIR